MIKHPPDANFVRQQLLQWYQQVRRDLPWRVPAGSKPDLRPDPWHVLVSEFMLQQTQVATVIPYFERFINRFPSPADLAAAPEHQVLRLWQGLGYYSRARNLQRAAQAIVRDHDGKVPGDPAALLALPGVGRYTAGAIASLAFGLPEPIVDGNVLRVLCRLDGIAEDPRQPAIIKQLWARAAELVDPSNPGDFNSAMMELGATVCSPRQPACLLCPLRDRCVALARGLEQSIPLKRIAAPTPRVFRWSLCLQRGDQWLMEQRSSKGRWAGLWQFVTIEAPDSQPRQSLVRDLVQQLWATPTAVEATHLAFIEHALTHRRYRFDVFVAQMFLSRNKTGQTAGATSRRSIAADLASTPGSPAQDPTSAADPSPTGLCRRWISLAELDQYPLSRPHLKIAELLAEMGKKSTEENPARKQRTKSTRQK